MVSSGMRSSRSNIGGLPGCESWTPYSSPADRFALAARARLQIPEQGRVQTATLAAVTIARVIPVTARISVAIVAVLAAGSLAIASAGAQENSGQESGTEAHPAHPHAHAHSTPGASSTASATGEKADASYSLGLLVGSQLPRLGLEDKTVDFQKFSQGLKDVMSGKVRPSQADQQKVAKFIQQSNESAARRFLAANGKLPGVKTTQSGLQYKV